MKKYFLSLLVCIQVCHLVSAQGPQPSGSIEGQILVSGKGMPYVTIILKGTVKGTVTDSVGYFRMEGLEKGIHEINISFLGFETKNHLFTISDEHLHHKVKITLQHKSALINEVVVTGTRSEKRRIDSAVPVNVLSAGVMESTRSLNLSEALSFQPGIRIEKDCQTCNYSQVRMNGMGGSYSQILINSRPVFSALTGLYGLEQIPTAMIEKVEIVKGGASALYGSNAIAGTINVITRIPVENSWQLKTMASSVNGEAADFQNDFYGSLVSEKFRHGANIVLSRRDRHSWDANSDGFSELAAIKNTSGSINGSLATKHGAKISYNLNGIHEIRNGGDALHLEPHERLQSEFRDAFVGAGNVAYSREFYGHQTRLEAYAGGQITKRKHYTGSFGADGYGRTTNYSSIIGAQTTHTLLNFIKGKNELTSGFEFQNEMVYDVIPAYQYKIDQTTEQFAGFFQSDWQMHRKLNLVTGLRITAHNLTPGMIMSPGINLLYQPFPKLQLRVSRGTGFRAPQAFDSDMHIAFSGGGIAITTIDPQLKPEKSVSYAASADYNVGTTKYIYGATVSVFHTRLNHAFILEEIPGSNEQTMLLRTNGSGALVKGITVEGRTNVNNKLEMEFGFTIQKSTFDAAVSWSESAPASRNMLRTPHQYGYFSMSYQPSTKFETSFSGVYTGMMEVPHFSGAPGITNDLVVNTQPFLELNFQVEYVMKFRKNLTQLRLWTGIQNITNNFQSDFDTGPNRDSNYMYGPGRPRTYFLGCSISGIM